MNTQIFYTFLTDVAVLFPTFIVLFTLRGFVQALVAYLCGDDTGKEEGFLTINPIAHVDVFGILIISTLFASMRRFDGVLGMVVYIGALFAIMLFGVRPYYPVPVDARGFRWFRLGLLFTTLAVPFSYFLMTFLSMLVMAKSLLVFGPFSPVYQVVDVLARSFIEWSLFWGILSFIPVPPFESGMLLPALFGEAGQEAYDLLDQYALLIFFGLFLIPGISTWFLSAIQQVCAVIHVHLMHLVLMLLQAA